MPRKVERAGSRCAIYTRKSTEEGLEQAFNSLDAQREACSSYIASQRHEGWTMVSDLYDDGGYSGGSMDRPGLAHLLADVKAGKVDVIVVYKVDRLTRSLADFAKIVEVLDAHGASFVSVTQAFNTTTSMGRLTLNVLLSFAQFEREVTGERIRDKIAASKARGMWMGGVVPLGYRVVDRKLIIVPDDAAKVRMIYERYLELGSVLALVDELAAAGLRSALRVSRHGRHYGDAPFSRGALYLMLQNRIYLGEICHKGAAYPGEHEAIIEPSLFDAVGSMLQQNRVNHADAIHADEPSLLVGKVWDGHGRRMTPNHACKRGRRYRYYVSRTDPKSPKMPHWRVPAADLEAVVLTQLRKLARELDASSAHKQRRLVADCVERIEVHTDRTEIWFSSDASEEDARVIVPASLVRRGTEVRLAVAPDAGSSANRDAALIKLVVKAQIAREALTSSKDRSIAELAAEHGYTRDYFGVLMRIAYLAPDIVTAILDGRQPVQLNRQRLARTTNLPIEWQAQREMLGFVQ
jgi:site-specific DNA recombinase